MAMGAQRGGTGFSSQMSVERKVRGRDEIIKTWLDRLDGLLGQKLGHFARHAKVQRRGGPGITSRLIIYYMAQDKLHVSDVETTAYTGSHFDMRADDDQLGSWYWTVQGGSAAYSALT